MKFVIVYLLVGVAVCHGSNKIWKELEEKYGPSKLYSNNNRAFECNGLEGAVCSNDIADCEKTFLCIPGIKDPFVRDCKDNQTCNNGNCSSTPSPLCEYKDYKFTCNAEGIYPDPSSCKKYNYCVPPAKEEDLPTAAPAECKGDWAYNPATTLCDKPLPSKACTLADRVVPKCDTLGQTDPLKASASYFYICLPYTTGKEDLYPQIMRCPNNQKYQGKYKCK